MKLIAIILFFVTPLCIFAQSDATFTVSKKKKVQIEYKSDTLAGGTRYCFKVYGISAKELIPSKFSGGEVWLNDTAVCIQATNNTSLPKKYLFELLLKKDNSTVLSRQFIITPAANIPRHIASTPNINVMPDVVFFSGVYSQGNKTSSKDSLISKVGKLLAQLTPTSRSKSKVDIKLNITFKCSGETTELQTTGLELSPEMISKIKEMGNACYFGVNVSYHSYCDPPEDVQMGPYRFDIRQ